MHPLTSTLDRPSHAETAVLTRPRYEKKLSYRSDIDGLRAIAVLSVISYHFFPGRITGGFVGVDIFFVISGYLISSIIYGELESGRFSVVEFYVRRIRRIYPALFAVLASVCAE
jgi:peptidoglycan/LPS O-acetylase OafA/YrhL